MSDWADDRAWAWLNAWATMASMDGGIASLAALLREVRAAGAEGQAGAPDASGEPQLEAPPLSAERDALAAQVKELEADAFAASKRDPDPGKVGTPGKETTP